MQEEFYFGQCHSFGNRNLGSLLAGTRTSRLLDSTRSRRAWGLLGLTLRPAALAPAGTCQTEARASLVPLNTPEGHTMDLQ